MNPEHHLGPATRLIQSKRFTIACWLMQIETALEHIDSLKSSNKEK